MKDWIMDRFNNKEVQKKAMQDSIMDYMQEIPVQKVVNDAIQSFKVNKINELFPLEIQAKEVLIQITKSKYMDEQAKGILLEFLITREVEGYEMNFSCIFEQLSA